jgi:multiple sugar transport system substrate-binding protein
MTKKLAPIVALLLIVAMLAGCSGSAQPAATEAAPTAAAGTAAATTAATSGSTDAEPVTITIWDYYGEATPVKPLIEGFEAENPGIKVDLQSLDWNTTLEKLNVVLAGGDAPDLVTIDMTWLPRFAALGAFTDLSTYANGELNGVPLSEAYSEGAMKAMTYGNTLPTIMCDFDTYALYYRADLFEQKGLTVPTTWDELETTLSKLVEGDQYRYQFLADTFHGAQFIYENGGSLLNDDNTQAVYNSPEAIEAIQFEKDLLDKGLAINWTTDQGERIQGVKDGRIAMFSDGPYYMGIMKSSAPEMSGEWRIAIHPYQTEAGSYLGGTGLSVPVNAQHKDAAWKFIEYMMRTENQIELYKTAGAAPALTAALNSDEVNAEDPYFGNEKVFSVFLESMKTARPFPYVRSWSDIDASFVTALQNVSLDQMSVKDALDASAEETDSFLSQQ